MIDFLAPHNQLRKYQLRWWVLLFFDETDINSTALLPLMFKLTWLFICQGSLLSFSYYYKQALIRGSRLRH